MQAKDRELTKDELMQVKDRGLARAQQQLRQKVNSVNYIMCSD